MVLAGDDAQDNSDVMWGNIPLSWVTFVMLPDSAAEKSWRGKQNLKKVVF